MSSADLATVLQYFFIAWLAVLAGLVTVKTLRGDINTNGLLHSVQGGEPDPERVASVATTLAIAGYYVIQTLGTPLDDLYHADTRAYFMPDLPGEMLALLGGSISVYVTGKFLRRKNGA
jgi:hypothetical protein